VDAARPAAEGDMVDLRETDAAVRRAFSGPDRGAAFAAAQVHSSRVRRLRIAIIAGCALVGAGLVGRAFYDPFARAPDKLSLASATLDGTRVTMERPKLSGYRQDGRPYDVRATSGVQDIRTPNVIELNQLEAKFETTSRAVVRVAALRGVYDSGKDFLHMTEDIQIGSDSGYEIRMTTADADFKSGAIVSHEPVSVVMTGGTINAASLIVTGSGESIVFDGDVRTLFHPRGGDQAVETLP
jgi:lipopolysaccharide export system protein LptC